MDPHPGHLRRRPSAQPRHPRTAPGCPELTRCHRPECDHAAGGWDPPLEVLAILLAHAVGTAAKQPTLKPAGPRARISGRTVDTPLPPAGSVDFHGRVRAPSWPRAPPDGVRYASVQNATRGSTVQQGDTP